MRRKVPPVTSSHAPKRSSYLYLEAMCSDVWSFIFRVSFTLGGAEWIICRLWRLCSANEEFCGKAVDVRDHIRYEKSWMTSPHYEATPSTSPLHLSRPGVVSAPDHRGHFSNCLAIYHASGSACGILACMQPLHFYRAWWCDFW
jgi:hypothetical protein